MAQPLAALVEARGTSTAHRRHWTASSTKRLLATVQTA
jgi:hypothetical protein